MKKKKSSTIKKIPEFRTDAEAEAFLEQDLSEYLTPENFKANFRPVRFEFLPKDAKVNLRLPEALLTTIKKKAAKAKMPYQRYIRHILEQEVGR